ncbi:MAG: hypothetical protein WBA59_02375 [Moheibacter sp.]
MRNLKTIIGLLILNFIISNLNAQTGRMYFTGEPIHFENPVIVSKNGLAGAIILEKKFTSNHFKTMLNHKDSYLFIADIYFFNDLTEENWKQLDDGYKSCNKYNVEYNHSLKLGNIKDQVTEYRVGLIEADYYKENMISTEHSKTILKKGNGKTYYKFVIANCAH